MCRVLVHRLSKLKYTWFLPLLLIISVYWIKQHGAQPSDSVDTFVGKSLRCVLDGGRGGGLDECQPRYNIMYLKTHKCASSTLQNIFLRYAMTHTKSGHIRHDSKTKTTAVTYLADDNLEKDRADGAARDIEDDVEDPIIVAVPEVGTYIGSPKKFTINMLKNPKWLLPPGGRVNVFAVHTRLATTEMKEVMVAGALWVTAFRHPVDLYISLFYYFKVSGCGSLRTYLENSLEELRKAPRLNGRLGINQMTFDLGYGADTFYDDAKIDQMIQEVEDNFDLILMTDQMDESLVMLGRSLCWTTEDLFSLQKNVRIVASTLDSEGNIKSNEESAFNKGRKHSEYDSKDINIINNMGRENNHITHGSANFDSKDIEKDKRVHSNREHDSSDNGDREKEEVLTNEDKAKLEALNYSDLRLYQHFARKFDKLVEAYGREKLRAEVGELRKERQKMEEFCVAETVPGQDPRAFVKEYKKDVVGFRLARPSHPTCRSLVWNARHFVNYFRTHQRKLFGVGAE